MSLTIQGMLTEDNVRVTPIVVAATPYVEPPMSRPIIVLAPSLPKPKPKPQYRGGKARRKHARTHVKPVAYNSRTGAVAQRNIPRLIGLLSEVLYPAEHPSYNGGGDEAYYARKARLKATRSARKQAKLKARIASGNTTLQVSTTQTHWAFK